MAPLTKSLLAGACLASVLGVPGLCGARCLVRPGAEGELSTWLVAGPYAAGPLRLRPSMTAALEGLLAVAPARLGVADEALRPDAATPSWRGAAAARAWLDVGAAVGGRGARVAYAAAVLDVATEGTRYLMVGTDDAVRVLLDGREVLRRAAPRESHDDQDVVALALTAGRHALVFKLASRGDLDLFARLTDAAFAPDAGVRVELPGVDDAACRDLGRRAASVAVERRVVDEGTRVDVTVSFPGGVAAVEGDAPAEAQVAAPRANGVVTMRLSPPESLTYHDVVPADAAGDLTVDLGADPQRFAVRVAPEVRAALLRARRVLTPLDAAFRRDDFLTAPPAPCATDALPASAIWSVERAAERLEALVTDGDPDAAHLVAEARLLDELLDGVAAGRDPYAGRRGALRRAYRSPLDGSLQEYSVYVPPSYRGDRAFPVVMGLHGLHGSAHRMLPILVGLYDEDETRTHADRYLPPMPDTQALLVAPGGYGDAFYRQQGEHDVLRVLDEVRRAYRTDPDRTYMTGLSMGGIGAAALPLHFPGVFAAAAALCGYHSYFVRHDTSGPRQPWETFLMELRSNDRFAENGLHLPMYVVQGTLDRPITNSTALTERYAALGYALESEFPALDHNVWSATYADGRIVPHFLRYRRDPHPRAIRFRTPELRWNTSAWLTVDAIAASRPGATARTGRWAEVSLDTSREGRGTVTTSNVAAFTLTPPRETYAAAARALSLSVDGDRVELPFGAPTTLVRAGGHWCAGAAPAVRAGGPIREVFDTPVLVVVGTGDPAEVRANERVARAWAQRGGVRARYPVVRDDSYTEAMGEGRTLLLVGRSNRLLARVAARLPVRVDARGVTVGSRRFEGDDVGAVFTAPDPDRPSRALLVVAGATPVATLMSRALPDLVPEFVVYDRRVAAARGRVILGPEASLLAAGFFASDGAPDTPDVVARAGR